MSIDRLPSASLQPGGVVSSTHFNISSANSIEYNVDREMMRRFEHAIVDWVVTIPTFYDSEFESGYNYANALLVSINGGDASKIDIAPGVAYIGGRRYKQVSTISAYDLTGTSADDYLIRLRFQLSTNTFSFITELKSAESNDSASVKYLTLGEGAWSGTVWTTIDDSRSTNTSLPAPITFTGTSSSPILTIEQLGTGNALEVIGNASGGDVVFFDTTNPRVVKVYGTSSTGLTLYDNTTNSVVLSCDNSGQLKIASSVSVATAYLGSMTASSTTFQGLTALTFGASATIGGTASDIAFSSKNFTGVGTIASGAVTSSGAVQGTTLVSTISTGTAPLTVASTTKVTNLQADSVDGFSFSGSAGTVTADYTELNILDGYTGTTADLNRIIQSGRSTGDILRASSSSTLEWLAASNGVLTSSSGTLAWSLTPILTSMTVGSAGITFDITGTDPVITAGDAALYFGDTVTLSDKASTPDWSITGAGVASLKATTVTTLGASTSVSITSGPVLSSTGIATAKAISGVTTISGTGAWATTSTIDFSGILSGATKTELNDAADATGRAAGDLRYASALNTLGWLPAGTSGYFLRMSGGLPAWQAVSYDNYGSWSFRADAGATDAINSGETLTFVSGTGITLVQAANQLTINSSFNVIGTPTDSSSDGINADWAYDHAVGQTVNLHTKVGTITTGTWQGTDVGIEYLDEIVHDLTMYGSDNAQWLGCSFKGMSDTDDWEVGGNRITSTATTSASTDLFFSLDGVPRTLGTKKLYISGYRVEVFDASVADYVNSTNVWGGTYLSVANDIYSDPSNTTAQGQRQQTFTAVDCSGYTSIDVRVTCVSTATAGELDIGAVQLQCYYA